MQQVVHDILKCAKRAPLVLPANGVDQKKSRGIFLRWGLIMPKEKNGASERGKRATSHRSLTIRLLRKSINAVFGGKKIAKKSAFERRKKLFQLGATR